MTTRQTAAAIVVLELHDQLRSNLSHDMSRSRRYMEIERLRRTDMAASALSSTWLIQHWGGECKPADEPLTDAELDEAARRILEPRLARLVRESYRTDTVYSRKSADALRGALALFAARVRYAS